jgi:hypothetical protein
VQFIALDLAAERLAGAQEVDLSDVFFQGFRSHAVGQGCGGALLAPKPFRDGGVE